MTHGTTLADVMNRSRYLLFDFDGPICSIFAGLPAPTVAAHLRELVIECGIELSAGAAASRDPFDVLRFAATLSPELTREVNDELRTMEVRAAESATATPHVRQVIQTAHEDGRSIAAVSNNSCQAVTHYLTANGLAPYFTAIVGRTDPDPRLLKPHPELINRAVRGLAANPAECVLIGDSLSDIEGARNAGTLSIGYANKPGKHERFTTAGADAIITDMAELLPHLSEHQAADSNAAGRRRRR
ncbi:HAD family hydrolase [Actinoallomurus iriomotensis]|uniref:Hydrolase n=1 Tax=Actinoallomurus iriomotensis TaxID=478107 RepID=A0A9W6VUN1_9ACTN|nr:HAD family hydrolase [Actinoallomurus iriomotensis]GLY79732.1 hydrolase [Actinoallomurus iriomotensis]